MFSYTKDYVLDFTPYVFRKMASHSFFSFLSLLPDPSLFRNKELKNKYNGEKCFILGSGPSIQKEKLELLYDQNVMTQNNFHMHDKIAGLKPFLHVTPPKHQGKEDDGKWEAWLSDMEKYLPPDCTFIFGENSKYLVESATNLSDRTYYVKAGINSMFKTSTNCDLSKRIMNVPTVLTLCLAAAVYMGFKKIYLLGMDLDQIVQFGSQGREAARWYKESKITASDSEKAFEDSLFQSGNVYLGHWLIWKQLNMIQNYAIGKDIEIANASSHGLLNVFPRIDLEKAIKN